MSRAEHVKLTWRLKQVQLEQHKKRYEARWSPQVQTDLSRKNGLRPFGTAGGR